MGIFNKPRLRKTDRREDMPEGLWTKCPDCGAMIHRLELDQNHQVCPHCNHHFVLGSHERILMLADPESFDETDAGLASANPPGFQGYSEKTAILREKTGINDAVVSGRISIGGHKAMIAVMDFKFFAGSMGSVVGSSWTTVRVDGSAYCRSTQGSVSSIARSSITTASMPDSDPW